MNKNEALNRILEELQGGDITAVLLVSRDGSLENSIGLEKFYADTFAAMCATMFGAGETANLEIDRDEPEYVFLKSNEGNILISGAGEERILAFITQGDTKLEELVTRAKDATERVVSLD